MFVIQRFFNDAWCDVGAYADPAEAKDNLRRLGLEHSDQTFRMKAVPTPQGFRYTTAEGNLIVQVEFEPGGRRYAYSCPPGAGEEFHFHIGDRVRVPANWVSVDGGEAVIVGVGTDYVGELAVVKGKV